MIQVAIEVELEQVGGGIGGPTAPLRVFLGEAKAGGAQVQRGDKGVNEAHRVVRPHVIFEGGGQQMGLATIRSFNPVHGAMVDSIILAHVQAESEFFTQALYAASRCQADRQKVSPLTPGR